VRGMRDNGAVRQSRSRSSSSELAVDEAKAVAAEDEAADKADSATGRKAKCLGLEARADASRRRLETARTELANAGVVPSDPQARRLAAILPITEEAIQLYQPIILPVTISVLGLLLIAVGAHTPKRRKARRRKGRKRRAARKPAPRLGSNVVRFRQKT
jgi:hypothetical protein